MHPSTLAPVRRRGRRPMLTGLALALGSSLALVPATAAHAATPFIVIGTSDLSDSNLVRTVIEPAFEAAYPQYDLQYVPLGTGAALDSARAGNGAAVIVHAASLENQFVAAGYSLESYGRSLFWGDYVLAGPASDPAGVAAGAPHDVVAAFEKVAAAGAAGKANFVARGKKPGTAVQERALWGLTTTVTKCAVDSSNGGGYRPSTTPDPCPDPDANQDATFPSWYHAGDSGSQAANVSIANACPFSSGKCYVFTDRGTLAYLQSTGAAQNLRILVRDNASTARGGLEALVNAFHVYAVNPAKFSNPSVTKTNAVAAKQFLDFLTSRTMQEKFGDYLNATGDGPFIPAASPQITSKVKGGDVTPGRKVTIKGALANPIPGYPVLSGVTVNLLKVTSDSLFAIPKILKSTTTDSAGAFTLKKKLKAGVTYRVGVGDITKIQIPTLSPPFGDTMTGRSELVGVIGGVTIQDAGQNRDGRLVVSGKVKPKTSDRKGTLRLYAARPGDKLTKVALVTLHKKSKRFVVRDDLAPGTYRLQLVYSDKDAFVKARSRVETVTIS